MHEITNIRGHRIRWSVLAVQGAVVGVISAMVVLTVAMGAFPLLDSDADAWTFTKGVSTMLLGADAASTTTRFAFVPMFWGSLAFGPTAGVGLATWVDEGDIDQANDERVSVFEEDALPVRNSGTLHLGD